MQRWWEKFPYRYERELKAFQNKGLKFLQDGDEFSRGKIVLRGSYPTISGSIDLVIKYPDTYPYFPPKVIAPTLELLPHHHSPADKTLCLLGQSTGEWLPEDTAASLLQEQLPKVLEAGSSQSRIDVETLEVHQAEPISYYYKCVPGSTLLVDSSWELDRRVSSGVFKYSTFSQPNFSQPLRGAVQEVLDDSGNTLAKASSAIAELFSDEDRGGPAAPKTYTADWVRLEKPPTATDDRGFFNFLRSGDANLPGKLKRQLSSGKEGLLALVFPEEVQWNSEQKDGWVFLRYRTKGKKNNKITRSHLIRAERAGEHDCFQRVPELSPLREKKIAIAGLGCVGAPSAIEFAKCGLSEINILDHDYVTPGNACRWPLGVYFTGIPKTLALHRLISANYPYTRVNRFDIRIGEPEANNLPELEKFVDGVDLIFDATAELGVQHLLSSLAAELSVPYILIESRPGGWGGLVARIGPGSCFYCLRHALTEGDIPIPPQKEDGEELQPHGCISPTFTASGFDTATVSLAGVRLAVSTLCEGSASSYPAIDHDVAVLSLRNAEGDAALFPQWTTYSLQRHPKCHCSISEDE